MRRKFEFDFKINELEKGHKKWPRNSFSHLFKNRNSACHCCDFFGLSQQQIVNRSLPDEKEFKEYQRKQKCSIVAKYNGEYYRINGKAKIYSSGKYLEIALRRSKPPLPKHAIVVDIKEVFDLDKLKKILQIFQYS